MSVVFDGFLCSEVGELTVAGLKIRRIAHDLVAVYWGSRSNPDDTQILDALCKQTSSLHGTALRIHYDSRLGCRTASRFDAGELKRRFDADAWHRTRI